jgi:predicted nucleic acid-binding protein
VTFDDLTSGTSAFVDDNCLVYAVTVDPRYGPACQRLMERIDQQDLRGFISAQVLSELAHRVMTLEAAARFSRPLTGMANWLRRHPAEVQQLSRHRQAIDEVRASKIQVWPSTERMSPRLQTSAARWDCCRAMHWSWCSCNGMASPPYVAATPTLTVCPGSSVTPRSDRQDDQLPGTPCVL